MFAVFTAIAVGLGYLAYRLSAAFTHQAVWFIIFSGLLAFSTGFLFKALFFY